MDDADDGARHDWKVARPNVAGPGADLEYAGQACHDGFVNSQNGLAFSLIEQADFTERREPLARRSRTRATKSATTCSALVAELRLHLLGAP